MQLFGGVTSIKTPYMKKPMLRLTLLALVTFSVFSSCKKDKDDKLAVNEENMVGSYTIADYKVKSNLTGNTEASIMEDVPACYRDDVFQLKAGGVLTIVDEGTTCNNNETATWSVKDNKVTLEAGLFSGTYEIVSFTKTQLVGSSTETEGDITVTYIVYLNRK